MPKVIIGEKTASLIDGVRGTGDTPRKLKLASSLSPRIQVNSKLKKNLNDIPKT